MDEAQAKLLDGLEDLRKIAANKELCLQLDRIQEKLLIALAEQKKEIFQHGPDYEAAFHKINGALADRLTNLIQSNPNVVAKELDLVKSPSQKWVGLMNSMQWHYGLSDTERSEIMRFNSYRSQYGYGGPFCISYVRVQEYAQFIRNLMEKYDRC